MTSVCKNCSNHFKGNFCSTCGQPATTHEMNFHFLWHDVQHGLLHVEKGLLYTAVQLFKRPGKAIREYIEGKRVRYFRPISLVLMLAGAYGFLFHFFHINTMANDVVINGDTAKAQELRHQVAGITEWMTGHYAVVALAMLPFISLATFIGFLGKGYNYVEHLVLNAFLTGQRLIVHLVLFPVYYFLSGTQALYSIAAWVNFLCFVLGVVSLNQFFDRVSWGKVLWRSVLSLIVMGIFILAAFTIVALMVRSKFQG